MDALVVGHVCIDLTPGLHRHHAIDTVSELMRPGGLVDVEGLTVSPGGAVSNTGLSLARMGMEVGLIGRVGGDPLAEMLRGELAAAGDGDRVRLELVEDTSLGTSYSIILPIPGLDRIFLHDSGANDNFSVQDLLDGCARMEAGTPRLMHFGYPTAVASMYRDGPGPLRDLLIAAKERGMTVSIDFSLPDPEGEAARAPWKMILAATMPMTDLCFPSVEELSLMLDPAGFHERERGGLGAEAYSPDYGYALAGELVSLGAAVVAVKFGGRGLLLRWDPAAVERHRDTGAIDLSERLPATTVGDTAGPQTLRGIDALFVPSYPVENVVSATGAGDTAIAGFLAALLAGHSLVDAAETGCVAGRNAVTTIDAVSSAQTLSRMSEFRRTASRRSRVEFEDATTWHVRDDGAFEHRVPTQRRTV